MEKGKERAESLAGQVFTTVWAGVDKFFGWKGLEWYFLNLWTVEMEIRKRIK